jgi:hypothetical protein
MKPNLIKFYLLAYAVVVDNLTRCLRLIGWDPSIVIWHQRYTMKPNLIKFYLVAYTVVVDNLTRCLRLIGWDPSIVSHLYLPREPNAPGVGVRCRILTFQVMLMLRLGGSIYELPSSNNTFSYSYWRSGLIPCSCLIGWNLNSSISLSIVM